MRDLAFGNLCGFMVDSESLDAAVQTASIERDWEFTPVLYSLPPGDDVTAAVIATGTDPMVAIYHTHATESYLPVLGKARLPRLFPTTCQTRS
jgi:hypothetical protein